MTLTLTTRRLTISPLNNHDAAAFVAYRQNTEVARWQGWSPNYSAADAARLIADQPTSDLPAPGGWLQLAIRGADGGALHGDVAVHALFDHDDTFEVGVTIAPASQHQGMGTEAVARVIDHIFAIAGARRVIATCDARNSAVASLLTRVGLRRESRQREVEFFKGEWITLDGYAILASERSADTITTPSQ